MTEKPRLWATIDRIERDEKGMRIAVLLFDDGQQLVVRAELLPPGARPHQVVRLAFQMDVGETSRRASQIQRLQQELFGE